MSTELPVDAKRKVDRGSMTPGCPVHRDTDGVWQIQDYATVRTVLRSLDTRQAGFGIENVEKTPSRMRRPVLYRDGAEHREHRRQTAKYFTLRRVDSTYREFMQRLADQQCARLRKSCQANLSDLSFALAVAVAANSSSPSPQSGYESSTSGSNTATCA